MTIQSLLPIKNYTVQFIGLHFKIIKCVIEDLVTISSSLGDYPVAVSVIVAKCFCCCLTHLQNSFTRLWS